MRDATTIAACRFNLMWQTIAETTISRHAFASGYRTQAPKTFVGSLLMVLQLFERNRILLLNVLDYFQRCLIRVKWFDH